MNPVDTRREGPMPMPPWQAVIYAEDQPEYLPLVAVQDRTRTEKPTISVWEPSEEECAVLAQQIADGRVRISIQLWLFTDGKGRPNPLPPMQVKIGRFDAPYTMPAPPDTVLG